MVDIQRATTQFWWCGDVEIDVPFTEGCSTEVYKDDDGDRFLACPTGDVVYDTNGKLLRSTIEWGRQPVYY
jgi:hypothetical protein